MVITSSVIKIMIINVCGNLLRSKIYDHTAVVGIHHSTSRLILCIMYLYVLVNIKNIFILYPFIDKY